MMLVIGALHASMKRRKLFEKMGRNRMIRFARIGFSPVKLHAKVRAAGPAANAGILFRHAVEALQWPRDFSMPMADAGLKGILFE